MTGRAPGSDAIARYSPGLASAFAAYLRVYLARSFDAIRVAGTPAPLDRPTVLYTNHPSWWDPVVLFWVLRELYPAVRAFGPIDEDALQGYPFFERLGAFGVAAGSRRGAASFLEQSRAVLAAPDAVLCVTAEGRFTDPRTRPVRLERGVAHLMQRGDAAQAVPVALEYPFWDERKPQALALLGAPLRGAMSTLAEQQAALETALEHTLDTLAASALAREAHAFETLLDGTRGVGGIYGVYRRTRARLLRRPFDPAHGSLSRR